MTDPPATGSEPSDSLTLIITTSPTPSAPSTELLSDVLQSLRDHCPGLLSCRVTVVFDPYERVAARPRLKKGQVTAAGAAAFAAYMANVKQLVRDEFLGPHARPAWHHTAAEAEYGLTARTHGTVPLAITRTADGRVTFVEPALRLGFGLAVRSALRLADTPYVWVQQHDWALASAVPLPAILSIMAASTDAPDLPVRYVAFPAGRMLSYASSPHVRDFAALSALTDRLGRVFVASPRPGPGKPASEEDDHGGPGADVPGVPLTPLFFWHDKPHVASTAHYLARVFPTAMAVQRGGFIEDGVGHRARDQMKRGEWHRWATWLYYPDDGTRLCLRHLQGRTWRGRTGESEAARMWRARNAEAAVEATGAATCEGGDVDGRQGGDRPGTTIGR